MPKQPQQNSKITKLTKPVLPKSVLAKPHQQPRATARKPPHEIPPPASSLGDSPIITLDPFHIQDTPANLKDPILIERVPILIIEELSELNQNIQPEQQESQETNKKENERSIEDIKDDPKILDENPRSYTELPPQEEPFEKELFMKRIELPVKEHLRLDDINQEEIIQNLEDLVVMKERYAKLQKLYQEIGESNAELLQENLLLKTSKIGDQVKNQALIEENLELKKTMEDLKADMDKLGDEYQKAIIERANLDQELRVEGPEQTQQIALLEQEKLELMEATKELAKQIEDLKYENGKLAFNDMKQSENEFCMKCHNGVLEKVNKDLVEQNENIQKELKRTQDNLKALNEEKMKGYAALIDALSSAQAEVKRLRLLNVGH
jgi:hypothetical protein